MWSKNQDDLVKLLIVLQDGPQIHLNRLSKYTEKEMMERNKVEGNNNRQRRKSIYDSVDINKRKMRLPVSIDRRNVQFSPGLDPKNDMIDAIKNLHGRADNVEKTLEEMFEECTKHGTAKQTGKAVPKTAKINIIQNVNVTPKKNIHHKPENRKDHTPATVTPKSHTKHVQKHPNNSSKKSDDSPSVSKRDLKLINLFGDSPKKKKVENGEKIAKRRSSLNDLPPRPKIRKIEFGLKHAQENSVKFEFYHAKKFESKRVATARMITERGRYRAKKLPAVHTSRKYEIVKVPPKKAPTPPPPPPPPPVPSPKAAPVTETIVVDLTDDDDYTVPAMTLDVKEELLNEYQQEKTKVTEPLSINVTRALSMPEMPSPVETARPVLSTATPQNSFPKRRISDSHTSVITRSPAPKPPVSTQSSLSGLKLLLAKQPAPSVPVTAQPVLPTPVPTSFEFSKSTKPISTVAQSKVTQNVPILPKANNVSWSVPVLSTVSAPQQMAPPPPSVAPQQMAPPAFSVAPQQMAPPPSYVLAPPPVVSPATSIVPILPRPAVIQQIPAKSPPVISIPEQQALPASRSLQVPDVNTRAPPLLHLIDQVNRQQVQKLRHRRRPDPPRNNYTVITNERCIEDIFPLLWKMTCIKNAGSNMYDDLLAHLEPIQARAEAPAFNSYYGQRMKANSSLLLGHLRTVEVRNFDILHVLDGVGKKMYGDRFTVLHRCQIFSLMMNFFDMNPDMCDTPFTRKFKAVVKQVYDRIQSHIPTDVVEPGFSPRTLELLRCQILVYGEIVKRQEQCYEMVRVELQQRQQQQKRRQDYEALQKRAQTQKNEMLFRALEKHRQSQMAELNQRQATVAPPPVNRGYVQNQAVPQTPPTTPGSPPTPPVNLTPPAAALTPPTTAEASPLIEVVSPPPSPLETSPPKVERCSCFEPISPGSPINLDPDEEEAPADLKPKSEVKKEVPVTGGERSILPRSDEPVETIDLTWLDEVDPQDMWTEVADNEVPIKTEVVYDGGGAPDADGTGDVDNGGGDAGQRESISPTDSGLGSPNGADSAVAVANDNDSDSNNDNSNGYKCLCGKYALFVCACNQSTYCGRDCQVDHWPEHQRICERVSSGSR